MSLVHGFPPVATTDARLLILGSMPGQASLTAARYYAHERNVFWRIMGDLLGAGPALPYEQRLQRLTAAGIALWDVIAACERYGSLDADIVAGSVQANDFAGFLAGHPGIERIYFNGTAAETAFQRHVLPTLGERPLLLHRLPSTSPAHAARGYAEKLSAWSVIVAPDNAASAAYNRRL
ncbi:MAG: DNA-deoxyinosine glycosylase [Dechloromonas sp.]|nr:MAG: DNA-deoxyinosine glycosylase [Dechloromonas sp.]